VATGSPQKMRPLLNRHFPAKWPPVRRRKCDRDIAGAADIARVGGVDAELPPVTP
jgi:hypothetical protein